MENRILGWDVEQIVKLCQMVNNCEGKNLLGVFGKFASEHGKNMYSVRNFYYNLIRTAADDASVRRVLDENGIVLKPIHHFSITEEERLLKEVLIDTGMSIRAACLRLADGDKIKAVRYQNKYRYLLKNKPDLVREISCEIQNLGYKSRLDSDGKILVLPNQNNNKKYITDDEIQALFLGLVRMIKHSAEERLFDQQNLAQNLANAELQKVQLDARRKQVLIQELHAQNEMLKSKLDLLTQRSQNDQQHYQKIKNLVDNNKMAALREFVAKLTQNEQKTHKKH